MKERYCVPSATMVMLLKNEGGKTKILLQRRQNTGFADGMWDFSCAGHVEQGESMSAAAVRELKEELGVKVAAENLRFAVLIHKRDNSCNLVYYNAYFVCTEFDGEPTICEPEKCSELKWFDFDNLPDDLIDDRKCAVKACLDGVHYTEYGW